VLESLCPNVRNLLVVSLVYTSSVGSVEWYPINALRNLALSQVCGRRRQSNAHLLRGGVTTFCVV
jgi:hypothetical protein